MVFSKDDTFDVKMIFTSQRGEIQEQTVKFKILKNPFKALQSTEKVGQNTTSENTKDTGAGVPISNNSTAVVVKLDDPKQVS